MPGVGWNTMTQDYVEAFRENGFAIIRGFLPIEAVGEIAAAADRMVARAKAHHATYCHGNLRYEIVQDPALGGPVLMQTYWMGWVDPVLEAQRRDPRYLALLEPLIGRNIKQMANQIHWKPPGASFNEYRYHQDLKFRERPGDFTNLVSASVTTGLAIDAQDAENGALRFFPGSHKGRYLGLSEGHAILNDGGERETGPTKAEELADAGLREEDAVVAEMAPGDLVIWGLMTVHGSGPNISQTRDRRLLINSYLRAEDSPSRGEWAFRDGVPTPLGVTPQPCKDVDVASKPDPYYVTA